MAGSFLTYLLTLGRPKDLPAPMPASNPLDIPLKPSAFDAYPPNLSPWTTEVQYTPAPRESPKPTKMITPNPTGSPSSAQTVMPTKQPTRHPTMTPTTGEPTMSPTAFLDGCEEEPPSCTIEPDDGKDRVKYCLQLGDPESERCVLVENVQALLDLGAGYCGTCFQPPTSSPTTNPTIGKPTSTPTTRPTSNPTQQPTRNPTNSPTNLQTVEPTARPTPTSSNTMIPTFGPTMSPTQSSSPTYDDSMGPSHMLTTHPTFSTVTRNATQFPNLSQVHVMRLEREVTYRPGALNHEQAGLLLSKGLKAKVIARSGQPVTYKNGQTSTVPFHRRPDAGACIPDTRPNNPGGWVYVSNSEMRMVDGFAPGAGGVGAITFDKRGKIIDYKMVLTNTTWNCGGGLTPWGTWVSCEEQPKGRVYQVDPLGIRKGQVMTMGKEGGAWESFTYDKRNMSEPHFYLTEDSPRGAVQRFTPNRVTWNNDPWKMLHRPGKTEYLKLIPNAAGTGGRYRWIPGRNIGRQNAFKFFPNVEGIDCDGESVYFVSKKLQQLYELNLTNGKYTVSSTVRGKFDGKPDQVARILANDNAPKHKDTLLYFTEEGSKRAGVHGRNPGGKYVTIFESPVYKSECAGLAFSPDGMKMYIAYQDQGIFLEVSRQDGYPFHAKSMNIKYHKNANNAGGGGAAAAGGGGGTAGAGVGAAAAEAAATTAISISVSRAGGTATSASAAGPGAGGL